MITILDYFWLAIIVGGIVYLLCQVYDMYVMEKAFKQRMTWLHQFSPDNDATKTWDQCKIICDGLNAVNYKVHAKELFWRRNPLDKYPDDFRNLVNQTTGG